MNFPMSKHELEVFSARPENVSNVTAGDLNPNRPNRAALESARPVPRLPTIHFVHPWCSHCCALRPLIGFATVESSLGVDSVHRAFCWSDASAVWMSVGRASCHFRPLLACSTEGIDTWTASCPGRLYLALLLGRIRNEAVEPRMTTEERI